MIVGGIFVVQRWTISFVAVVCGTLSRSCFPAFAKADEGGNVDETYLFKLLCR